MNDRVAVFTDTYLPTVNGVTYTVTAWREEYNDRGGRMDVVYPDDDGHDPRSGEYPVGSLPFPFYEGFRVGLPDVPPAVRSADVVHAHTPFSLGLAGMFLARERGLPLVVSYHTPASEYADYLDPADVVESADPTGVVDDLGRAASDLDPTGFVADASRDLASEAVAEAARRHEREFYRRADAVTVPSETARAQLADRVDLPSRVEVIGNGVDTDLFRPVDPEPFLAANDLPTDRPLVGYTGRHGHEKDLGTLLEAAEDLDATVVLAGDGPARDSLRRRARSVDADVRFPGFLDREMLPAFYSALDAFAFPSPVETEGLVALEANACGTPVVGADAGALAGTVEHGVTGYRFPEGDSGRLAEAVELTLAERDRLAENCLDRREETAVERSVDRVQSLYGDLSTRT